MQRIVMARARTPCKAVVGYRLEIFDFEHSDIQLERNTRPVIQFENVLSDTVENVADAATDSE